MVFKGIGESGEEEIFLFSDFRSLGLVVLSLLIGIILGFFRMESFSGFYRRFGSL